MLTIIPAVKKTLQQLYDLLLRLEEYEYTQQIELLNKASIGAHYRHTIEMFICLIDDYHHASVNYDLRGRDVEIETNKEAALKSLQHIMQHLPDTDKAMKLNISFSASPEDMSIAQSSYARELIYTLDHAVHHMAIIRIALLSLTREVTVSDSFGVASSTIRYKRLCAQ